MGSSISALALHLSNLASSGRSFSSIDELIKLYRDLSLVLVASYLNMGCLSSFSCFLLSRSVATLLLILCGAILDRQYILFIGVGQRHPVIVRQVSFNATSMCLKCFDLLHTGYAYSIAEKHNANPVVLIVCGRAPHWVPDSFFYRCPISWSVTCRNVN